MPRSGSFDLEEFYENPLRFAHEDPSPAVSKRKSRRNEEDDVEPLDLGDSYDGDRFGRLSERDFSGGSY